MPWTNGSESAANLGDPWPSGSEAWHRGPVLSLGQAVGVGLGLILWHHQSAASAAASTLLQGFQAACGQRRP